jgi:flagellar hook-associated protein 3 FlgL
MDDARSLLQDTKSTMMGLLSDVEDIDLPSAVIELQTQENIYQAALAINLRVMNMSLLSTQLAGR